MGINTDPFLGRTSDEEDADESQENVNQVSLYFHNQRELLTSIQNKTSRYELNFLIDEINSDSYNDDGELVCNTDFWKSMLIKISQHYSLNALKFKSNSVDYDSDFCKHVEQLLIFIKVFLIEKIISKEIQKDWTMDGFVNWLNSLDKIPYLMKWVMIYLDKESFNEFFIKLFTESNQEFDGDF